MYDKKAKYYENNFSRKNCMSGIITSAYDKYSIMVGRHAYFLLLLSETEATYTNSTIHLNWANPIAKKLPKVKRSLCPI